MTYGAAYEPRRFSLVGLGVVIGLHAAAIAAVALIKGPAFIVPVRPPLEIFEVPPEVEPEPLPQQRELPKTELRPQHETTIDLPPRRIETPVTGPVVELGPQREVPFTTNPPGEQTVLPLPPRAEPVPVPEPVRVEAQIDPRHAGALQPDYPAVEQRAEREGSVTIRVTIGVDGRVKSTERVRATSEAFWRSTDAHARRAWRFRPATVDGRPIESTKVMTVHFRLDDL